MTVATCDVTVQRWVIFHFMLLRRRYEEIASAAQQHQSVEYSSMCLYFIVFFCHSIMIVSLLPFMEIERCSLLEEFSFPMSKAGQASQRESGLIWFTFGGGGG